MVRGIERTTSFRDDTDRTDVRTRLATLASFSGSLPRLSTRRRPTAARPTRGVAARQRRYLNYLAGSAISSDCSGCYDMICEELRCEIS